MDRVIAMVENRVAVPFQHLGKLVKGTVLQRSSQRAQFIQCFAGPGSGAIRPDMLELVFQDHDGVDHLIHLQQLSELLGVLLAADIGSVI